jgi:pilus assembly protein FimV
VVRALQELPQELTQESTTIMAGIGGLLLLILSWFGLRYRRRKQSPQEKAPEVDGVQSVFEQAGGRNIDTSNSVFHSNFVPSVSQLDTNEVDAVAEADVYIAYGRDEQAEEILQDALRLHPDRHALRVKLLGVPWVNRKPDSGMTMITFGLPPVMYWHSRQWHCNAAKGSPSAT